MNKNNFNIIRKEIINHMEEIFVKKVKRYMKDTWGEMSNMWFYTYECIL